MGGQVESEVRDLVVVLCCGRCLDGLMGGGECLSLALVGGLELLERTLVLLTKRSELARVVRPSLALDGQGSCVVSLDPYRSARRPSGRTFAASAAFATS